MAARARHLRQAVHADRGTDAAAAARLAGDGGADPLSPRSGLRRDLRAGARAPAPGLPDPQRGALLRRHRHRRDGVGGRQPGRRRRAGRGRLVWQVRPALGRALRRLRRRDRAPGVRVGREGGPGAPRRGARGRRPPGEGGVHHPVRDLDRRRQRHPRAERGGEGARLGARRRRRVGSRRRRPAAGRVGGGRGRRGLAEVADVPARSRLRIGVRPGHGARRRESRQAATTWTGVARPRARRRIRPTRRSPRP